jgi:hypothetical protein
MITIQNAQVYSAQGEIAYQVDYSDGTKVRAVESKGSIIRKEWLKNSTWTAVGKPYVVNHSKVRDAEKIKAAAIKFCDKE